MKNKGFVHILLLIVLFLILSLFASYYFFGTNVFSPVSKSVYQKTPNALEPQVPEKDNYESDYFQNLQYGYEISLPQSTSMEKINDENYLSVEKFGGFETLGSLWFSVSVSERSPQEEIQEIKLNSGHTLVKLESETNLTIQNYPATKLSYVPVNNEGLRSTTFVVITNGEYTYTISSIPEDIDFVLANFTLTN